jgi:hypothetical protein
MARKKTKREEEPLDHFAYWQSIQLTPEQKAAAREELWEKLKKRGEMGFMRKSSVWSVGSSRHGRHPGSAKE